MKLGTDCEIVISLFLLLFILQKTYFSPSKTFQIIQVATEEHLKRLKGYDILYYKLALENMFIKSIQNKHEGYYLATSNNLRETYIFREFFFTSVELK